MSKRFEWLEVTTEHRRVRTSMATELRDPKTPVGLFHALGRRPSGVRLA